MDEADVSVIVVTRNNAATLPLCLQHLEAQTHPAGRFEIVVVDRESDDGSAETADRFGEGSPVRVRRLTVPVEKGPVGAYNAGAKASRGRYLLFMDGTLAAGAQLVARHLAAHDEHERVGAVLGRVTLHPQVNPGAFTRWYCGYEYEPPPLEVPLRFMDWRAHNFSIARKLLAEAGYLDEGFAFPLLFAAELGWRLARRGLEGRFEPAANAYHWREVVLDDALARRYAFGFCLHRLVERTRDIEVLQQYPVTKGTVRAAYDHAVMPLFARVCRRVHEDTRLFGYLYRRILRHAFYRGYQDAASGRAPRVYP